MKLTTASFTLCALFLAGFWTLAACTVTAVDGTEYQLYAPALNGAYSEPSAESSAADIIVQLDDHALILRTIAFEAPISGLEALERSGLDVTTTETSFGPAVCAIEGVGCPADDCFCGGNVFWNYSYWEGEAWQSYPVGASSSVISQTGAIEGWRWGEWGAAAMPATQAQAAQAGLSWLAARQVITDGSYSGSVGGGLDVLLALGANNQSGAAWRGASNTPSLLDFTVANGVPYAEGGAAPAGKLALALAAAQGCFPAGVPVPTAYFDEQTETMAIEAGPLALAVLGALSLDIALIDADALAASVDYLHELAQPGGGWEWFPGWGVDTNTTSLAIQALMAAGVESDAPEIDAAVGLLRSGQNPDGGFPYDPVAENAASDTNSTSYVIQGLIAAGQTFTDAAWQPEGRSPLDFLLSMQVEEGAFIWQSGQEANQLATQQAVPALLGRAYPLNAGTLMLCE